MPQVFISYSRKDLTFVERLAADLKASGSEVWYDLSNLEGGSRWNKAIEQAIKDSQYVVVVLSPDSLVSRWVDDEVGFARSVEKKIIPLCYRPCDPGLMYVNLHRIDVQGQKYIENFNQILRALDMPVGQVSNPTSSSTSEQSQAQSLTYETHVPDKITLSNGMEFMRVPAGKFIMGSFWSIWDSDKDQQPQHTVDISYDYWMARYPVTNKFYGAYMNSIGFKHPVGDWEKKLDHPVVGISWKDAMAYCKWLNAQIQNSEFRILNLQLRLPTEAEWEKAARGIDERKFPWGDSFYEGRCNTEEEGKKGTTPVGLYSPQGDSPYGCADMSGNVWEWTHSLYKSYPYKTEDGRENEEASGFRVRRGGCFFWRHNTAECTTRCGYDLLDKFWGLRVVASPVHF